VKSEDVTRLARGTRAGGRRGDVLFLGCEHYTAMDGGPHPGAQRGAKFASLTAHDFADKIDFAIP